MTRAQSYDSVRTFTVRELVAYGRLIVNRERVDPDRVVHEFIRANPHVDMDARSTIIDWQNGIRPGNPGDTAERPRGYF